VDKKSIRDLDVTGKKVLVRVDFNVPMKDGKIINDTRILKVIPTIKYLQEQGAKIILMTHLGRPKGKVVPEMSVKPIAERLSSILGQEVIFAGDCGGPESLKATAEMDKGQVVLLENLRFYPEEEENDTAFAKDLAALGEIYVNDAFGTAHRAHASTEGVTHFLPAVSGFLTEREILVLSETLENPSKPFVVILGGAKVSDKICVIEKLMQNADCLLIGGAMANTFLKAQGYNLGKSKVEEDKVEIAAQLLNTAKKSGVKVILPTDLVVANKCAAEAESKVVAVQDIPEDMMALDIGPATVEEFSKMIAQAGTIVWNGPLGVYEFPRFAVGTNKIVEAAAAASGKTVIGGGDVVAAVEKTGLTAKIYHISTGGGASLAFLGGKVLPGVAALLDK